MLMFRVDDFPGTKPQEFYRHNIYEFQRFDAVFQKYNLNYILGVIPAYTTDEHLLWLRNQKHINVAVHGIWHNENRINEFDGFKDEQIIKHLFESKKHFEDKIGKEIITYIPPHNFLDIETMEALVASGFSIIMTGPGYNQELDGVAEQCGLKNIYSEWPIFYGRSDELINRDNAIPPLKAVYSDNKSKETLSLHWTWERNLSETYESLHELLSGIKK